MRTTRPRARLTYRGKKNIRVHRLAYELANGVSASDEVDHLCHSRACVNPGHLRSATRKQNSENHDGPTVISTSGVRGVTWDKQAKRWKAQVGHNGKSIYVGHFTNLDDAEVAVITKRNQLHTHNDVDRVA